MDQLLLTQPIAFLIFIFSTHRTMKHVTLILVLYSNLFQLINTNTNLCNFIDSKGFDLPRAFERLRSLQIKKLNDEQRFGWAGGKSDVVLIIPYQSSISQNDKEFCHETLKTMREEVPGKMISLLQSNIIAIQNVI
jgi:hypothetical protein